MSHCTLKSFLSRARPGILPAPVFYCKSCLEWLLTLCSEQFCGHSTGHWSGCNSLVRQLSISHKLPLAMLPLSLDCWSLRGLLFIMAPTLPGLYCCRVSSYEAPGTLQEWADPVSLCPHYGCLVATTQSALGLSLALPAAAISVSIAHISWSSVETTLPP